MPPLIAVKKPALEIAHILQHHLEDYKRQYRLGPEHQKILSDLLNCRTAKMGGRVDRCDTCGSLRILYHSCRNRHGPKCQHMPRERWLARRQEEILPVNYFHVVFTLPHELNAVILNHKKLMLNGLFAAASQTLLRFGQNELGGSLGFLAVLHTWDQTLKAHFHLHCLVAGGVVADNGQRWIPFKANYLFNQRALSLVFRGKFMQLIHRACQTQRLKCDPQWYQTLKHTLFAKNWVVSVRDPVKDPQQVLDYLARYTHRVAIANSRITSLQNEMVTFTAKNRKKNRTEPITISAVKFIRRFLLHSLPTGLVRIRHYGFLANRNRRANLSAVRVLLGLAPASHTPPASLEELMRQLTGVDITTCPCCHRGHMHLLFEIPNYWARAPTRRLACAG
jgi:Putative transposase/Transposase zinc-binding domain